jgi:hypothetical protein
VAFEERYSQGSFRLNQEARQLVLPSLVATCRVRGWLLHAAHVRSAHVHLVVDGGSKPESMLNALKAHATRALRAAGHCGAGTKVWSRHGSTRYLWRAEEIQAAIQYTVKEQGSPMAVYEFHPF